jgi:flagellar FliL protein
MAEMTPTSANAPQKKNVLIIIPIAFVVIAVQAFAAYFLMTKLFFPLKPSQSSVAVEDTSKSEQNPKGMSEHRKEVTAEETGAGEKLYQFPDIIVNPAGTGARRFLVVSMSLEMSDVKVNEELKEKEPILRDALITLLAAKSFEYVSDVLNMETLRSEILQEVNKHLTKGKVVKIYFTGYVLQ